MPERFKTQRYEDRESSKLGLGDYFTKHAVWLLLPFIGFAVGGGIRKLTKLPFLEEFSNPLSLFMSKENRANFQEMAKLGKGLAMRRGEAWGLGLGSAYGTYRLWSANTKQQLEVDQLAKNVEDLRGMESANSHLNAENEQLRQQIKFADRHASRAGTSHAEHALASKDAAAEIDGR